MRAAQNAWARGSMSTKRPMAASVTAPVMTANPIALLRNPTRTHSL
jgi:hypothetical protein